MKKLLGILFVMFVITAFTVPVYAGPADERPAKIGDDSTFLGVKQGFNVPPICDNYGYVWYLQVAGPGQLTGTVDAVGCGIWNVTGSFDAVNVQLTATNPIGSGCAEWFTYTGTHTGKKGKTASGTWVNSAGASGSWSAGLCN
ncbi:MAG: hypothetical protein E3K32_07615 [wastewater metagenome]|nr:hypothetical protein [Candidatus Loosdrechtia aerotolerans]